MTEAKSATTENARNAEQGANNSTSGTIQISGQHVKREESRM